ncbi:MAG: DMT family transporter, partial [Desulfobacterota bacterium]|nr:DMT family transporter [Thermodesulfobacteriota bacterium]
ARFSLAVPFLLPFVFLSPIPSLDLTFWKTFFILLPLEVTAISFYIRAIKLSPLSLTIPLLGLTPLFLIITSFLILGEFPDRSGLIGIFFIAGGAYLLNLNSIQKGFLAPLQNILKSKGSLMMIGASFIYSITSNLGKIAVFHSNPIFFCAFYTISLAMALSPRAVFLMRKKPFNFWSKLKTFLPIGFFYALMTIAHYQALARVEVAYMISIKRMSLIFSVIYGGLIFKEENLKERLFGTLCMITGAVLITLFSLNKEETYVSSAVSDE